jgi:hypothetical protein
MADEEFQTAQNYLTRPRPGDAPMPPPPPSPMNKTPNALPPAGGGLFDDIPEKHRKTLSPEEKAQATQRRKDTMRTDREVGENVDFPHTPDEYKSWAKSLNIKHYQWATELDKWLQGRGFTGIMDPKLGEKEQKAVRDLMIQTAPHWYRSGKGKIHRKPGESTPNDPKSDEFVPPGKKSELQDVPGAVSALGGRMMEDEDAA